jgi:hypothetical protein
MEVPLWDMDEDVYVGIDGNFKVEGVHRLPGYLWGKGHEI